MVTKPKTIKRKSNEAEKIKEIKRIASYNHKHSYEDELFHP